MGGRHVRFREDRRAISPHRALLYFAVIPLICTLMLAVPLGYFTSTNLSGGKVTVPSCTVMVRTTEQGNWTLTVLKGKMSPDKVSIQITSSVNGTRIVASELLALSVNFTWNDNNGNVRFDAGDTILIHQTGIGVGSGVELYYDRALFFHGELAASGR